jgi:hypothetical protein
MLVGQAYFVPTANDEEEKFFNIDNRSSQGLRSL